MKTKIIALVLAFTFIVTVLSGCNVTLGAPASLPNDIDAEGRFIYTVVRPETASLDVENAAKDVRGAMKDNFGCKVNVVKDNVVEAVDGTCEILVGNTNRPESAQALKIIEENRVNNAFDYVVTVINNKVCIQATTDSMLQFACDWFIETFCGDLNEWALLKQNYKFLYEDDTPTLENVIAGINVGKFTVVKPLRMSYLIGLEVENFIKYYKNNGLVIPYVDDMEQETSYEILIGETNREASKSVVVEGDNYVIKVIGTKLVIKGGSDLATWRGVKEFYDAVLKANTTEPFNWTDGYVINGKYDPEEENAYTLNFGDDFEGSSVDISKWGDYNFQAGRTLKSCLGGKLWYSGPLNESTAYGKPLPHKNVYQSDGTLKLATYKLNDTDFVGTYASTFFSMLFKYGVWEINAMMGEEPGCMSFWLNGTGEQNLVSRYGNIGRSCMTEVDLLENYGNEARFETAVHRWFDDYASDGLTSTTGHVSAGTSAKYHTNENTTVQTYSPEKFGGTMAEQFNYFSLHWTDEYMNFAFNGKTYLSYTFDEEQSVSVHCLLNYINLHFRMGDASYGRKWNPETHPDYSEAELDWLRIYQTDAINSQMVYSSTEHVPQAPTTIVYPDNPIKGSY